MIQYLKFLEIEDINRRKIKVFRYLIPLEVWKTLCKIFVLDTNKRPIRVEINAEKNVPLGSLHPRIKFFLLISSY